jgi:hypothetical protein
MNLVRVSRCPEQRNCTGTSAKRRPPGHDDGFRACSSGCASAVRSPGIRAWRREFSVELSLSAGKHIAAALTCASRVRPESNQKSGLYPSGGANDPVLFGVNPDLGLVYPHHSARKIVSTSHFIVDFTHILGIVPIASRMSGTLAALVPPVATKDAQCSAAAARKDTDGNQGSTQ